MEERANFGKFRPPYLEFSQREAYMGDFLEKEGKGGGILIMEGNTSASG